ncbi:MAG: hypothetical protein KGL10_07045 [Alphaproteobacteria bacterium]|nr:hypothetical protein [Alphaproteobacteria bacterium]MDE2337050.1 hypothetical protein [Alphaproteobacteria bacterium]
MAAIAEKFRAAARKPQDTAFDFDREVAQVWRDFPEVKDKIFFFDASDNARLVYPEEGKGREAAQAFSDRHHIPKGMQDAFAAWRGKNSYCQPLGGGRRLLFVLTEKHPYDKISPRAPLAQETAFVFDHELGHAVIPEGTGLGNRGECIADAYATIRHLQRYGADSPFIGHVVNNRAFDLVFRDQWYGSTHFTSSVTGKILECRHDVDWAALTPLQTAALARKFALEHEIGYEALHMLEKDFSALHEKADSIARGDKAPLKELAKKVLSTDVSDVFKYGAAALALYVDKRTADAVLQGRYWNKVRRKLAKKEKALAPEASCPPEVLKNISPFKGKI